MLSAPSFADLRAQAGMFLAEAAGQAKASGGFLGALEGKFGLAMRRLEDGAEQYLHPATSINVLCERGLCAVYVPSADNAGLAQGAMGALRLLSPVEPALGPLADAPPGERGTFGATLAGESGQYRFSSYRELVPGPSGLEVDGTVMLLALIRAAAPAARQAAAPPPSGAMPGEAALAEIARETLAPILGAAQASGWFRDALSEAGAFATLDPTPGRRLFRHKSGLAAALVGERECRVAVRGLAPGAFAQHAATPAFRAAFEAELAWAAAGPDAFAAEAIAGPALFGFAIADGAAALATGEAPAPGATLTLTLRPAEVVR
jgi:hypothetical protein